MREGRGSRAAEQNALFRALESTLPESRRLFEDHLARTFLTWPLTLVARLAVVPGLRELVPWLIDNRWPRFLAERGLSLESDVGAAEYRKRYFGDAARKMRGHEFYRVALASVGRAL